jgi:valyl-tRNA synthetase
MAPYITEELFQLLKIRMKGVSLNSDVDPYTTEAIQALDSPACMIASYPKVVRPSDINPIIDQTFELIERTVYTIRNIRGEVKIPAPTATDLHIIGTKEDPSFKLLKDNSHLISALVRTGQILFHHELPSLGLTGSGRVDQLTLLIPLPEELQKREKERLEKEHIRLHQLIERMQLQLSNEDFVNHAPTELVQKNRKTLEQSQQELTEIKKRLFEF